MLVYSPDGVAEEKEPCDARECIANCGYTAQPKEDVKPVAAVADAIADAPKRGRPAAADKAADKPAQTYQPTVATVSETVSATATDVI